jgi:hypothetical protein
VRNGEDGTNRLDGIRRSKGAGWRKPERLWEWTHSVKSVEGRFFGKAQERSSEEFEWDPRGSHEEETEPHLLQCVSEGGAKVDTTSSDGV